MLGRRAAAALIDDVDFGAEDRLPALPNQKATVRFRGGLCPCIILLASALYAVVDTRKWPWVLARFARAAGDCRTD